MKNTKSSRRVLWILLAIVVVLLVWASSERRLRPAYVSIAKFENKMRGIDGISAASLAKVKGDARRHSKMIRKGFGLFGKAKETPEENSDDFVELAEAVPDAILEIRYYSTYNFVGARIDGYKQPTALLTREAAEALRAVSDDVIAQGYRLKIYDAYRPQRAVDHFVRWAADVTDTLMKPYFYPDLDKSVLFEQEYIMEKSGHTRGSTVDLTLFDMTTEKEVDMGGTFDWFGIESHPDYTATLTPEQYANRMILRDAMVRHGFKTLDSEWWHFTLKDEPYPDTYFTFPVRALN
ncbi:MAG: M15 family metallopeptidase [Bacteroidales bacterium]|nr:M15 family metallopeptidase [Bacteroidales bacterium]